MSVNQITVVGGSFRITGLNTNVEEKMYDIGKAHVWLSMIQDHKRPTKWMKARKNGTEVEFDLIKTQDVMDESCDELEMYIRSVNRKYGDVIEFNRNKEA